MIKKDVRSLSLEDLRAFFNDKGFKHLEETKFMNGYGKNPLLILIK
jgi:hypothetical protein